MTIIFKGIVFRAHKPRRSISPTSGEGARFHGGRFNPKGVAALYTSLEESTAFAEHQQGFLHRPQPMTLCAYEVECADILDLTDSANRKSYKIRPSDLACPWEDLIDRKITPPSWEISQRLMNAGVAGIIVPSYAKNAPKKGRNLVFWRWGETNPHRVTVIDDEYRLPKNKDAW